MRRGAALGLVAVLSSALAACGSGSGTVAKSQQGNVLVAPGYLTTSPTGVAFIQWTRSGISLSGSALVVSVTGTVPNEQTTSSSESVSGELNGDQLTFHSSGGCTNPCFGQLTKAGLTLNIPQQGGSLGVKFR